MKVYRGTNVNTIYPVVINSIQRVGLMVAPRGSPTLEFDEPVTSVFLNPHQMLLLDPVRDENPFFLLHEALWILAGRDDVEYLDTFLPSLKQFSDNGEEYHGAYGERIHREGQLEQLISRLKADPHTRQGVLAIYDARRDSKYQGKDLPCNCMVFCKIRDGKLNLTVANRSNDALYGAYSVNKTQFAVLQQYIAAAVGVVPGTLRQVSDSLHVYTDSEVWSRVRDTSIINASHDPYASWDWAKEHGLARPLEARMLVTPDTFDAFCIDLREWFRLFDQTPGSSSFKHPTFSTLVVPLTAAHHLYRIGNLKEAVGAAETIEHEDWRFACVKWLHRRIKSRSKK